jgi:RNA polymerase-interacting CarD/CdnL/TRCF family regulator
MAFKVGDRVVLSNHGVGRIVRLDEKRFAGAEARLYYEVNTPNSTIWVPADDSALASLRPVTSRGDLARYREVLRSRPVELDKDRRQRQIELNQRLKQGSFQALCEVVRDLTASSWRKPLNESDSLALKKALDNLCQEWAIAAGVDLAEATHQVDVLLAEARAAYRA